MKDCIPHTRTRISIILSILGFFVTGIFTYPYGTFWDSARVFSYILVDGHANIDNWQGWYFPLLWEFLYKVTQIPNVIGCYINLLYWTGITILYISIFEFKEKSLAHYFMFCWFPGALLFVTSITNNALMFVNLLLGIALFFYWKNKSHRLVYVLLSVFFLLQCIFIRRDAICYIPLFAILIVYFYLRWRGKTKTVSVFLSSFLVALFFFASLLTEKYITDQLPNYKYIDAATTTALTDMLAVSAKTGSLKFPERLLKEDSQKACSDTLDYIFSTRGETIYNGDNLFYAVKPFFRIEDIYQVKLTKKEIISFYKNNIKDYLIYRLGYAYRFILGPYNMTYTTHKGGMILYEPSQPNIVHIALGYLFPFFTGGLYLFYLLAAVILFFIIRCRNSFFSEHTLVMLIFVIAIFLMSSILCFTTSIACQWRYIYTMCLLVYYSFFFVVDSYIENKGVKL